MSYIDHSRLSEGAKTLRDPQKRANRIPDQERGQILLLVVMMMMSLMGVTAMVVDVGRVFICYHQLQASTDASALAGGEALGQPNSTTTTTDTAIYGYASASGDDNVFPDMSGVVTTRTYECYSSLNIYCYGAGSYNAVRVQQTVNVPTSFAAIFGTPTVPLTAISTAAMSGAATTPYNVAIILDATLSQTSSDDNCGTNITEMQCELNGAQVLLENLLPCASELGTCSITNGQSANPVDQVALFTFPALSATTASIDSNCTTPITSAWANKYNFGYSNTYGYYSQTPDNPWTGIPTALPYSFPTPGATSYSPGTTSTSPTYQVTPFLSDYRVSDTATTLNPNSVLSQALGAVSGCGGMLPPNYDGDIGTYYAGVIYAAQSALIHEQSLYPGSENVMILLSDGDSNSPQSLTNVNNVTVYPMPTSAGATNKGTYPSWVDECHQATTAAQYAASTASTGGTRVYSIAYGSESSGCSTDTGSDRTTPCATMKGLASNPGYFFSDYEQSGNNNTDCVGTGATTTSLSQIFYDIYTSLTKARLIPNQSS